MRSIVTSFSLLHRKLHLQKRHFDPFPLHTKLQPTLLCQILTIEPLPSRSPDLPSPLTQDIAPFANPDMVLKLGLNTKTWFIGCVWKLFLTMYVLVNFVYTISQKGYFYVCEKLRN